MRLEDIFKNDRSIASSEMKGAEKSSPLSEFLSMRTPRPSAPAVEDAETKREISPLEVENIKSVYSTMQPERYIPVSDVVDVNKIKAQAETLAPRETKLEDALANLAPVAVEALLGGGETRGISGAIAGQSILSDIAERDKKRTSLEQKLMELKKLGSSKGKGGLQMKSLLNKQTGEKTIGMFDPSGALTDLRGNILDAHNYEVAPSLTTKEFALRQDIQTKEQIEKSRELGTDLKTDPNTGLLGRWENGVFSPVQTPTAALNPIQKKDLDTTMSKFLSSDAYKKPFASLQAAGNVEALLADATSGNPVAAEVARSEIAKMAEGGGKLTDQDIQRVGGDQSIKAIARRYVNLQQTGMSLTPQDLDNLRLVADTLYKVNRLKIMDSVGGLEKAYSQKGGPAGAVQTAILAYIPASPKARSKSPSVPKQGVSGKILMISPKGVKGYVPEQNVQKALKNGFKVK